jgi:hypothetical protein
MTVVLYIFLVLMEHHGQVMFGGVPVPGVSVTATQGDKKFTVVTDQQGAYSFPELADGPFTIQVEMLGFSTLKQEVTTPTASFELKMVPIEELHAEVAHGVPSDPAPAAATTSAPAAAATAPNARPLNAPANGRPAANQPNRQQGGAFQRTQVNESGNANATPANNAAPQSSAFANLSQEELNQRAADGLNINGTVNNGAASPFAQLQRIGNNLRNRPLYNGNASIVVDNSALDAQSYSLTGQATPKPDYNRFTGSFNFGGPLRFPHLSRNNAPQFFVGYQRTQNRNANTMPGRMPTAAERNGDFSQSLSPLGQPVTIIDPTTGQPFSGNIIPQDRISAQSRFLASLFPLPNFTNDARYNYQIPLIDSQHSDAFQGRMSKVVNQKNQVAGNVDIQSSRNGSSNLFNFLDTTRSFGVNAAAQWTTRPTQRFNMTFRVQFNRQATRIKPYFANNINVSGFAGIAGNNQDPTNWGSPALNFSSGISSLSDAQYSYNRTQNTTFSYNAFWNRGRHNVTYGADMRRYLFNVLAQQDARGTFTFTGASTGYDFAGFLLGIPDTSSIAFGNADKYYRQRFFDGYFRDDWRVNGALTLNLTARWEYETPTSETQHRLVNLNVAKDFTSAPAVIGNGLIKSDAFGIQPRLSFAWRPIAASSVIVRGDWGIYRNTNVYQTIAAQMAQQAPLSTSLSVQNSATNPLTLANGFLNVAGNTPTTFAIDPNFRVGFIQNWSLSLQRDLPAALQMTATYSGTKGSRLPQEFLPNTYATGAVAPFGYVYMQSKGNSIRNAGIIQIRRRLRNGFTATTQYTYAKALDNAPLMAGGVATANQGGSSIAQNWQNLDAERARSSFDQRHQLSVQGQYTTGVGLRGGALLSGWRGRLFKEWTVASQLTIGSGLPLTPIYFAPVPGTGVVGTLRPDATGLSVKDVPDGLFLNPAAFRAPAAGQWGNAGRNSITGPKQFAMTASLGRSFPWHDRYNIDVRVDATNALNRVTYRSYNTTFTRFVDPNTQVVSVVPSQQFGLPSSFDQMRKIQTTVRLRF